MYLISIPVHFIFFTMKYSSLLLTLLLAFNSCDHSKKSESNVDVANSDDKMEWWRDARFGMFIHWGLYSIPAGEWNGVRIPGISEWILLRAGIPVEEYKALAAKFNPVKYDADEWVRLAKEAGMKYIVITSKHHDGFAMFDSDANDFNIYDATPFKRDPLKELAEACKKHGLHLGFYYSQAQDWTHPGGTYRGIESGEPHWDPDLKRVPLMNYIKEKAAPQVKEILTKYGDIAIIWWDTPIGMTEEAADTLHQLLRLRPGIIENNRLYRPWPGDFSTPEQHIPPTGLDYDWEVCMTMNTSWGYKWYDDNWKSTETIIRNLVDIASKGGNYLLNVGPTSEGLIPEPSVERLKAIGEWMKTNGESIYGSKASPFFKLFWGRCTSKKTDDAQLLYLHVFDWPENGMLIVPGLKNEVLSAHLLSSEASLSFKSTEGELIITVPPEAPDPINSVVVIEIEGEPEVMSNMPQQGADGIVELPARLGFIHNRGYGEHALLSDFTKDGYITNWVEPQARVEWIFALANPGNYRLELEYRTSEDASLTAQIGEAATDIELPASSEAFTKGEYGPFIIPESGNLVLQLKPKAEGWNPVDLKKVRLIPMAD